MYGGGKDFGSFTAKHVYKVASCEDGISAPSEYDYTCLTPVPEGCNSIKDTDTCGPARTAAAMRPSAG